MLAARRAQAGVLQRRAVCVAQEALRVPAGDRAPLASSIFCLVVRTDPHDPAPVPKLF